MSSYALIEVFSVTSKLGFGVVASFSLVSLLVGSLSSFKVGADRGGSSLRFTYFRLVNLAAYVASFSLSLVSFFYFYLYLAESSNILDGSYTFFLFDSLEFEWMSLSLSLDLFGVILIFLAYVVGLFSLVSLDTRLPKVSYRFYTYFNFFLVFVYIYAMSTDLILFFVAYELLLLPSFFFVYFVSYSKKAVQASLYFVI